MLFQKVFDEKPFRDQQNNAYRQFNSCSKLTVLIFMDFYFTARCTLVQSAVLRSHVVCLSVCDVGGL